MVMMDLKMVAIIRSRRKVKVKKKKKKRKLTKQLSLIFIIALLKTLMFP